MLRFRVRESFSPRSMSLQINHQNHTDVKNVGVSAERKSLFFLSLSLLNIKVSYSPGVYLWPHPNHHPRARPLSPRSVRRKIEAFMSARFRGERVTPSDMLHEPYAQTQIRSRAVDLRAGADS